MPSSRCSAIFVRVPSAPQASKSASVGTRAPRPVNPLGGGNFLPVGRASGDVQPAARYFAIGVGERVSVRCVSSHVPHRPALPRPAGRPQGSRRSRRGGAQVAAPSERGHLGNFAIPSSLRTSSAALHPIAEAIDEVGVGRSHPGVSEARVGLVHFALAVSDSTNSSIAVCGQKPSAPDLDARDLAGRGQLVELGPTQPPSCALVWCSSFSLEGIRQPFCASSRAVGF